MRMIKPQAATPASGRALYSALTRSEFDTDDEGECFVSVSVGSRGRCSKCATFSGISLAEPIGGRPQHRPVPCRRRGETGVRQAERSWLVDASAGNSDRALRETGGGSSIQVGGERPSLTS